MSDHKRSEKLSRRAFLRSAAVAGGAASATALSGGLQAGVEQPGAEKKAAAEPKGYHETQHIRDYYEKARF